VDRFVLAVSSQPCREPIGGVEQPGIAGFGGEQDQLTDSEDAAVVIGCPALNIAHLIGETETLALDDRLARSTPDGFSTPGGPRGDCHGIVHPAVRRPRPAPGQALLAFVYHCFDRIVIYGYLSGLSRPEQVLHFFRQSLPGESRGGGVAVVDKEVFSRRTADYQAWVEAFARNHRLPIEWAEKGVRKEDHVLPWQRRMARDDAYGVYFIFKSMEQGPSFRVSVPKYPTKSLTSRKRGIQITGSSPANAAASRTTTSTSATKPWAR
jgi:hypothetical protein